MIEYIGFNNNEISDRFKEIIKEIYDDLELDMQLSIVFDVFALSPSAKYDVDNNFIVSLNSGVRTCNEDEFAFIVAHEMRHIQQYSRHNLERLVAHDMISKTSIWKGNLFTHMYYGNPKSYYYLPWEVDANEYAMNYFDKNYLRLNLGDSNWGRIIRDILNVYANLKEPLNENAYRSKTILDKEYYNETVKCFIKNGLEITFGD